MPQIHPAGKTGAPASIALPASGYLLDKISLLILSLVLLLAAWKNQTAMVILLGTILSAAGFSALWSRLSLTCVRCRRVIRERRLFPGEATELSLQLDNRKLLPLPWITVEDEIPLSMAGDRPLPPALRPGYGLLSQSGSLFGYRRAGWKFRLEAARRGYYEVGPLRVTSGDIFGFYPRRASFLSVDPVIVYPRIFPLERLSLPSLHPLGESRSGRRIFQDPTRPVGLKDYHPQDSLRHIHWKASARKGELQVKVFEPTTTLKICLFLAVGLSAGPGEDEFELAVSSAASLAYHLLEKGAPVGLLSNAPQADSGLGVSIPAAAGKDHLMELLEALAKVTLRPAESCEIFLRREISAIPAGSTVMVIGCRIGESLLGTLRELSGNGYKLMVLLTGDPIPPRGGLSFPIFQLSRPEDLAEILAEDGR